MIVESGNDVKTPMEIYQLADRVDQVRQGARLMEYALRQYAGDFQSNLTRLYNENRKIFDKPLRDRIRFAFEIRGKIRNPDEGGSASYAEQSTAAEAFIAAAEELFRTYPRLFPEKFLTPSAPPVQDSSLAEKGFVADPGANPFSEKRTAATSRWNNGSPENDSHSQRSPTDSSSVESHSSGFRPPEYVLPKPSMFGSGLSIAKMEPLCQRLGRSLKAGVAISRAWENETNQQKGSLRSQFSEVLAGINSGDSLADSLDRQECFPPVFREMVRVGEETGRLAQALLRLSDHYRHLIQMRRTFIQGITWPLLQMVGAVIIMSLFFVVLAVLEGMLSTFKAPDVFMMGFSPLGNLLVFWMLLGGMTVGAYALIKGISKGWFGATPIRLALKIPLVGNTIRIMALSRFAWSFGMAIDSGMDAVRAIRLGVRSTQNHYYTSHEDPIADSVAEGNEFYTSLDRTGVFPEDFMQSVQVGELTGELTESLERLSDDYREQAELNLRKISQISGFLILIGVLIVIGTLVIMMWANYLGMINEAINTPLGAKDASGVNASDLAEPAPTLEQIRRGELPETNNPITAARNEGVKNIVNSPGFKNIESFYNILQNADKSPKEFLDSLDPLFESTRPSRTPGTIPDNGTKDRNSSGERKRFNRNGNSSGRRGTPDPGATIRSPLENIRTDGLPQTSNPIVAARNESVKNIVNSEGFKKIESYYDVLKNADKSPHEFLDSLDSLFEKDRSSGKSFPGR